MPIVSSIIASAFPQTDGSRHVREEHTTASGAVLVVNYTAQAGDDINATLAARVPALDAALVAAEIDDAIRQIQAGADPLAIVFVEQDALTARRSVLKRLVRSHPEDVFLVAPTLNGLTDAQLENFLNVAEPRTTAVRSIINKATAIRDDFAAIRDNPDRQEIE